MILRYAYRDKWQMFTGSSSFNLNDLLVWSLKGKYDILLEHLLVKNVYYNKNYENDFLFVIFQEALILQYPSGSRRSTT